MSKSFGITSNMLSCLELYCLWLIKNMNIITNISLFCIPHFLLGLYDLNSSLIQQEAKLSCSPVTLFLSLSPCELGKELHKMPTTHPGLVWVVSPWNGAGMHSNAPTQTVCHIWVKPELQNSSSTDRGYYMMSRRERGGQCSLVWLRYWNKWIIWKHQQEYTSQKYLNISTRCIVKMLT